MTPSNLRENTHIVSKLFNIFEKNAMDYSGIKSHVNAFKEHNQILDAIEYLVNSFGLNSDNLAGVEFRNEESPNSVVLTTEGDVGKPQMVTVPKNILDFDLSLVLNLIAHEMLHVRQKAPGNPVEDKNEREWQAYYEMLFHKNFPNIPEAPDFNRKQFAEKALEYYRRMGESSDLQKKYASEKTQVENLLDEILVKRGEKPAH